MRELKEYPTLQKVLREAQRVTIFCGAGVSCSLSDSMVTWYSWLKRGLEYIDDNKKRHVEEKLAHGNLLLASLTQSRSFGRGLVLPAICRMDTILTIKNNPWTPSHQAIQGFLNVTQCNCVTFTERVNITAWPYVFLNKILDL